MKTMTNWNHLKLFSREELLDMVPKGFEFKTSPWDHQIAAFLANISNDGFLDALDLGTGKTKVVIDTCRYFHKDSATRALYVCLNTAIEKMRDEILTHSDFSVVCIKGDKVKKWSLLAANYNFSIIGYESLRALISKKVKVPGRETRKEVIDPKNMRNLLKLGFNRLIIDESHTIKSPRSLIFRIIKQIAKKTSKRYLLTGTPFGNTMLDVWSQYFIIDFGETFGLSFSIFKNSHFKDKGWFGPLWKPTETGEKFIQSNLYNKAIRYKEDECDDLPPKVFNVLKYNLSKKQREAYKNLLDNKIDELNIDISSKAQGFRQISSGFIKSSDYVFKENPKLDLLWDIIENVVDDHKIVVFFEYTKSREIVEAFLKKKKIKFNSLSGATKDKYKEYNAFQTDNSYRVMCAQIKSGGASIDLFAATYCIYYEHGGSVINYKQSSKRIHRGGQKHKCFFYSLLGVNTVEISIHRDLNNGIDAFAKIVDKKKAKKYIMGR